MSEPEPLNKKESFATEISATQRQSHLLSVYERDDVKSAVQWLHNEMADLYDNKKDPKYSELFVEMKNLIDQAFYDVTKED